MMAGVEAEGRVIEGEGRDDKIRKESEPGVGKGRAFMLRRKSLEDALNACVFSAGSIIIGPKMRI